MGQVVQWAEAKARKLRSRASGQSAAGTRVQHSPAFEVIDCGSGWYHGEAIRAARASPAEPR